jgi:hypothetical protein
MTVWSSDTVADDWTPISSDQVLQRALRRLESRGRGILLLHDIQSRTALMLPRLLRELKARGFRIVHVVPARGIPQPQPKPVPEDTAVVMLASASPERLPWPRLLANDADSVAAITEKARQIASLGVVHSRSAASGEPAAKHIRPRKPEKAVQSASLSMVDFAPAGALR